MLIESAGKNRNLSGWAKWALYNESQAARETRELFEICLRNLADDKKGAVCRKAGRDTAENVDSLLHELLCHELLRRLDLSPEFKPKLSGGLTPDMRARIADQDYIVEVFETSNPDNKTNVSHQMPTCQTSGYIRQFTKDQGDRAKKIRDEIRKKHNKYAKTGRPLLVVVSLKDGWMQEGDVETAFYGACRREVWLQDCFPKRFLNCRGAMAQSNTSVAPPDGAALTDDVDLPGCPKVSAVLACNWFDTLNRESPGMRLHGIVLHHWKPEVCLPVGKFGQFPEMVWRLDDSGCHKFHLRGSERMAAKFAGANELEFHDYDPTGPW